MESVRASQRRQGSVAEAASQQSAIMDTTPAQIGSQSRSASGTGARPHGSKSSNPDKQISQIEKSVTHLLVATKQLLETLTQWSRGNAQEEEVSDVYVRLGYEFNLACRAFSSIGVDTTDLGPVPDLLRTILEDTLSQPASPQALDNYLPRIRDIIINLLQGLKRKQSKLRTRPTKDATGQASKLGPQQPGRQMSTTSGVSGETTTTLSPYSGVRRDSPAGLDPDDMTPEPSGPLPSIERSSLRRSIRREPQKQTPSADSSSTIASTTAQNLPVLPPPQQEPITSAAAFPHPPPPPPKQDALTALQRGGDLERRASRRFSAYQIQKHLGASPNGVPVIPPAQNSPIPNRGREVRESMRAVTSRTSYQPGRQKSGSKLNDVSPSRTGSARPERISEEQEEESPKLETDLPRIEPPKEPGPDDSPTAKTPEEFHAPKLQTVTSPEPQLGATVNGPFSPTKELPVFTPTDRESTKTPDSPSKQDTPIDGTAKGFAVHSATTIRPSTTPPPTAAVELDSSPPSAKELTLFLQYKTRIKKFVLPGGYEELSLARLQLAFIEKFAWNTHNNGVDLPEIYIQDLVSGVRHELEDLSDVKDRSVLVLNFEVLDEVKKHFDEGLGSLKSTLENVKTILDGQGTMMQRFSDRQLEASKEMARLSATPTPRVTRAPTLDFDKVGATIPSGPASEASLAEVQNLRRDIAVLKQTYSTMSSDFAASMASIKAKAAHVKEAAATVAEPSYEGAFGRVHVNEGKKKLQTDSEVLVNRVDNLSDTVEDLRKDVVARGVRPRPADLERLSKEISGTAKALAQMKEFMKREKPAWTKVWENELNQVCVEREELSQQEELMADLHGDLEDVQNVFNLVEEAMKQQNIQGGTGSLRQVSKTVGFDPTVDPGQAKEGVLDEVRALRPNHEDRLEAIERAEAARKRDLEARQGNEFQKEVAEFVEEGKLKKTG
ncbi:Bud site selection protein 6, partial [Neophaeococcomyces mojaviensis]